MPMEQNLEIVISDPTTIQSEVPKQQPIRQPSENDSNLKMADENSKMADHNGAKNEDSYVEVFTSKKEEAVFTKGDLKLQKVEIIADPNDSEIYSQVIEGPQPLRELKNGVENCDNNLGLNEDKNITELNRNAETPAEKRPKSRIPRLRLAVERVRQELRESAEREQKKEVPTPQQRRSSIPRRRRQSYKSPPPPKKETKLNNKENNETASDEQQGQNNIDIKINEEQNVSPEDFDKMYDEIIHTDESLPFIDSNVQLLPIVDNLEDPVSLENTFEEMINDYEEKKVEPINVKEIKSKIPLLKQKSLPEGEFNRRLDRRSSLKDREIDDIKNRDERKSRRSKLNDIKNRIDRNTKEDLKEHKRLSKEILKRNNDQFNQKQVKDVKTKYFVDKSGMWRRKNDKSEENKASLNKSNKNNIKTQSNDQKKKSATIAKPVIRKPREQSTEENIIKDDMNEPVTKKDPVLEKTKEFSDLPESTKLIQNISQKEIHKVETDEDQPFLIETTLPAVKREYTETTTAAEDVPTQTVLDESMLKNDIEQESCTDTEKPETPNTNQPIPTLRGKVSKLTNKFSSNEPQPVPSPRKDIDNDQVPRRNAIWSKIAIFNKDNHNDMETDKNNININKENQKELIQIENRVSVENNETKKTKNINDTVNTITSKDDLNLHKDIDRPKFVRTRSAPLGVPHILRPDTLTPPNTPRISLDLESAEENHKENLKKFESASDRLGVVRDENENYEKLEDTLKLQNESKTSLDLSDNHSDEPKVLIDDENELQQDFEVHKLDFNPILDRQPSFEAINAQSDKNHLELKGKVSKIINRIVSVEEKHANTPKKEIHVPIKSSVSSKIAMFERQAAVNPPKLNQIKTSNTSKVSTKPRIIEEVLKTQPPRTSYEILNQYDSKFESNAKSPDRSDYILYDPDKSKYNQGVTISNNGDIKVATDKNIVQETKQHEIDLLNLEPTHESCIQEIAYNKHDSLEVKVVNLNEANVDMKESKKTDVNQSNGTSYEISEETLTVPKNKGEKEIVVSIKEDRQENVKHFREEKNFKNTKSVEKLDMVFSKGKVHQLISRMQLLEKLEIEKKNDKEEREKIIKAKLRLRKRSVSDEIASFEHKISTFNPDTSNPTATSQTTTNPVSNLINPKKVEKTSINMTSTVNLDPAQDSTYRQRIEDLKAAKETYGTIPMKYIELNNGVKMPVLSLGTAMLDPVLLPHIIGTAIDLGFRAIDAAYVYGNEKEVGDAIRAKIQDGTVLREDLFIIGKLWSTFHRRDLVEGACRSSLEALGLEYFDLYLIHNPMSFKVKMAEIGASLEGGDPFPKIAKVLQYSDQADYLDAWYGMETLVAKGLAKSIGVSNFNSEQISRIVEKGKIKPVINQVECHPYLTQQRLGQFCADRNITLMCYGVLGSVGTPKEYRANTTPVLEDPLVNVMAAGLGVSPAQLLISYQIQSGHPVVTKASSAARLWDCLQSIKLPLNDTEIDALNSLNKNKRTFDFKEMGETHRNYPFKTAF